MNGENLNQPVMPEDDASLVRMFQADHHAEEAFEKLLLRYKDKVFNLCYRFLGDYEEANDCAQETFVKVYRALKGFRFDSQFSTWLYRITVNTCKNRFSSAEYRYKKKMVHLDAPLDAEEGDSKLEIADNSFSPVNELERKEKEELIQKAIESLPEDQRKVVILRDIELLSYEEIAKITGFNLGTVKSKLSRARAVLAQALRRLI